MHFATIFTLAAAFSGVFAVPMPQDGTVSIAGSQNGNGRTTTTTTVRPTTTTTTVRPTTTTKATTTTTATPSPTGLPKCKNRLTFNIKAKLIQTGDNGKNLASSAIGQYVVDVGGPVGFKSNPTTEYILSGGNDGFLTDNTNGNIVTVKTSGSGVPHIGNLVIIPPSASIAANWSPLRCTGAENNALACVAKNGDRKVLQVCGNFIDMENVKNDQCQDVISFDVIPTCQF